MVDRPIVRENSTECTPPVVDTVYTDDTVMRHMVCQAIIDTEGHPTPYAIAKVWKETITNFDDWRWWCNTRVVGSKLKWAEWLDVRMLGRDSVACNDAAMIIAPVGILNAGDPKRAALQAYDLACVWQTGYSRECAGAMAAAHAVLLSPNAKPEDAVEAAKKYCPTFAPYHPRLDPDTCRVVEGYAVLQPRVTSALPFSREGSLLQRVFSGPSGIDPYAFAVSDVYQDLFSEGSYAGKGIYDVDVFEAALAGRVPESCVLSHDLLEGTFARAGLVSDVEVIEEFPSRYEVLTGRQHRWARGDWQLLPWILGRGRDARSDGKAKEIPWVGRWKMLDNLRRRTLSAPAALSVLAVAWTLPIRTAAVWTAFVCAMIAVPVTT